jgi:hypothetical protein
MNFILNNNLLFIILFLSLYIMKPLIIITIDANSHFKNINCSTFYDGFEFFRAWWLLWLAIASSKVKERDSE